MPSVIRKRGTAVASPNQDDKSKNDIESADSSRPSEKDEEKPDKVTFVLVVILVFLLFYNFVVPRASKIRHKRAMEHQYKVVTAAIQEQQNSLAKQYDSLFSQVKTLEGSSETSVSQSHHEEEVKKIGARHESHAEEIALLKADLVKKQAHSQQIEDQLNELREQMRKIQAKMGFDHHNTFCDDCIGNFNGLKIKCGLRRDYLMRTYATPKDIATEGILKLNPNDCGKKDQ